MKSKNLFFHEKLSLLLTTAFESFFRLQSSSGIVLLVASVAAIAMANSPLADVYSEVLNVKLGLTIGSWSLAKSLLLWINDGLMTIFFFLIGLEIKREMLVGELSSLKKVMLPAMAAVGGMLMPASIYLLMNNKPELVNGWAIPTATDIAFSLGVLSLLGKSVPSSLKVFLLAFAIFDDLGAVLIIALFYSKNLQLAYLAISLAILMLLLILNYFGFRIIGVYVLLGIIMWYVVLKSGLHPTLAGVFLASTIPAKRKINLRVFQECLKKNMEAFTYPCKAGKVLLSNEQIEAIDNIESAIRKVQSPLQSLEHQLHGFVVFIIMPLFAFANAGIVFDLGVTNLANKFSISVASSLVAGKVLGIMLFTVIAVATRLGALSKGITWWHLLGVSFFGGIGFTMSIFISTLSFTDAALLNSAKIGIFLGSLLAALIGYVVLRLSLKGAHEE